MMDHLDIYRELELNSDRIGAMVHGVTTDKARWRPEPGSWSMLEVINHLYDEEREDFRVRLDYLLHHPGELAPDINPQGWVTERKYNERDLQQSLVNFQEERAHSLAWLKRLPNPNWNAELQAPFGIIIAGDMLAAWSMHDCLHIRQLVKLHGLYLLEAVKPYNVSYASPKVFDLLR